MHFNICKWTFIKMLKYIFTNYCREHNNGGVRKYKELLTGIVNKVNMLSLVNCSEKVLKLLQIKEKITLPIVFESRSLVDRFLLTKSADLPDNPPEGMYS